MKNFSALNGHSTVPHAKAVRHASQPHFGMPAGLRSNYGDKERCIATSTLRRTLPTLSGSTVRPSNVVVRSKSPSAEAPLKPLEEENTASDAVNASSSGEVPPASAQPSRGRATALSYGTFPSAQLSSGAPNVSAHAKGVTHSEGDTHAKGATPTEGALASAQLTNGGPTAHAEGATRVEGATNTEGATHVEGGIHTDGATNAEGATHAEGVTHAKWPTGTKGPTDTAPLQEESDQEQRQRRKKLWIAAIKPPLYSVAIAPVMVGAATAFNATGVFHAARFWQLLIGAVMVIAWLNLSNDGFDAATGVDKNKAESVVNLTGGRAGPVLLVSLGFLAGGALLLHRGISSAADPRIGLALATAVGMGYLYQGPPFRLSYKGLGEPLCFFAFGPLATLAFHMALAGPNASLTPAAFAASILVGASIAVILFCSHFHQIEGDVAAGKASPLTWLGPERGMKVLTWAVLGTQVMCPLATTLGFLPMACTFAMWAAVPQAVTLVNYAEKNLKVLDRIRFLKLYAVVWQSSICAALAAGLVLPRVF